MDRSRLPPAPPARPRKEAAFLLAARLGRHHRLRPIRSKKASPRVPLSLLPRFPHSFMRRFSAHGVFQAPLRGRRSACLGSLVRCFLENEAGATAFVGRPSTTFPRSAAKRLKPPELPPCAAFRGAPKTDSAKAHPCRLSSSATPLAVFTGPGPLPRGPATPGQLVRIRHRRKRIEEQAVFAIPSCLASRSQLYFPNIIS